MGEKNSSRRWLDMEYDEIIQRSGDHPSDWMKNSTNVKNVKNRNTITITITNQKQMRNLAEA